MNEMTFIRCFSGQQVVGQEVFGLFVSMHGIKVLIRQIYQLSCNGVLTIVKQIDEIVFAWSLIAAWIRADVSRACNRNQHAKIYYRVTQLNFDHLVHSTNSVYFISSKLDTLYKMYRGGRIQQGIDTKLSKLGWVSLSTATCV